MVLKMQIMPTCLPSNFPFPDPQQFCHSDLSLTFSTDWLLATGSYIKNNSPYFVYHTKTKLLSVKYYCLLFEMERSCCINFFTKEYQEEVACNDSNFSPFINYQLIITTLMDKVQPLRAGVLMKAGYWQSAPACKTSNHCLFSMPLKPPKGKEALKPMYQAKTPNTPSKAT